ncbi:MAG TPA: hypothetical protein VGI05_10725, partial [Streptosporangiaceae bacterium]
MFGDGVQEGDVGQCFRSFTITWLQASPEHRGRLTGIRGLTPESCPCPDRLRDRGNAFRASVEQPEEPTGDPEHEQAKDRNIDRYQDS